MIVQLLTYSSADAAYPFCGSRASQSRIVHCDNGASNGFLR